MKSINQVRHFYVATREAEPTNIGDIKVVADTNGDDLMAADSLVFKYMSPGRLVTSDIINIDNILYANYTPAANMGVSIKTVTVELSENAIVGQEYIVKVLCKNYAGAGDDNITVKYGMAVAESTDKVALITKLKDSLQKNSSDLVPLFAVKDDGAGKLTISATVQDYQVGVKPLAVTDFDVEIFPITKDGAEFYWAKKDAKGFLPVAHAKVSQIEGSVNTVSGMKVADLEWFHTGARGDMYRNFGHPYGVRTELLADPTKTYDIIDIHYSYVGPNEGAQKSEKTISIAAEPGVAKTINNSLSPILPKQE